MFNTLKTKIYTFIRSGHERTRNIKKNIIYSFLIKGLSVLIGFSLFPLTINYVNSIQYGLWLTIASLVAWMNTFDIGLSNGLRNKLTHAIATNQRKNFVKYVSTTYILLFFIVLVAFGCFFISGRFVNWNHLLGIQNTINFNIWPLLLITLGLFCVQFILQPVNSILAAIQQPFKASLILLCGQLLTLMLILILKTQGTGTLLILVWVAGGSPVISLLLGSAYLFATSLKEFSPRINAIDLKNAKKLLSVGGAFFLIQIGALVLYETDNIIITRTLGLNDVTIFNIAFKYFSIITVAFSIFITPYWSAFTEAYAKKDIEWIKYSMKKMKVLCLYFSIASMMLFILSNLFYKFWIGNETTVPLLTSLSIAIYNIFQMWTVIHAYFLNGVGKLRIQLILIIITALINIPLSIWLIRYAGIAGTVLANIIVMALINIFNTRQCRLIINDTATGIWNK